MHTYIQIYRRFDDAERGGWEGVGVLVVVDNADHRWGEPGLPVWQRVVVHLCRWGEVRGVRF